eukprot:CAMPEP_0185853484 /NCGR_PEP_ID=MMETSP1354-20130828/19181_1 /TAXON_ID=708628 /ORGANISM="Erythrolobus madagascarensis, Strain CCMP3276" /LENGTH=354 /DNA_ID=CAMNT_0028554987 /DNA_START=145 /DNA_END=1209 /DNA_ORIENTATION=+
MSGFEESVKRHVYANSMDVSLCPIISLALYLLVFPANANEKLFPGASQYDRFRKRLAFILEAHGEEVRLMGIDPGSIGVHSIRKGGATFACSGSTAAPPLASLCNRAGWTMGKAKDVYIRYEAAADRYVGRVVAGLDVLCAEFAGSPPYIAEHSSIDLSSMIANVFAAEIPLAWMGMARFALASVVYYRKELAGCFGQGSAVATWGWFVRGVAELVAPCVKRSFAWDSDNEIEPTGIPPHVIAFADQRKILAELRATAAEHLEEMRRLEHAVVAGIVAELDSRHVGGGELTLARIQTLLEPIQKKIQLLHSELQTQNTSDPRTRHGVELGGTHTSRTDGATTGTWTLLFWGHKH